MFGTTYGHGVLRKYVIYFGTLFNNLWLNRYDASGNLVQNMKVPLNYGPREKFLAKADGNPENERPIAIQLPRMSFEMTNMYYDPSRKTSSLNQYSVTSPTDPTKTIYQYAATPYNIEFSLSIMVKNAEDGTFIVEQILPYFTPDWTGTLNLNTDMGQKHNVPITLSSVSSEDIYEGSFEVRRALVWTLTFTMKGWFFGPTRGTGPGSVPIREIDVNFRIPPSSVDTEDGSPANSDTSLNIDIQPGMFANGDPTSARVRDYTYALANSSGAFTTGELVTANSSTYAYVVEANATHFIARNITGTMAVNSSITGALSAQTATINSVSISPPLSVSSNSITSDDTYGFLVDFIQ